MLSGTKSRATIVRAMEAAFVVEAGQILIRWLDDDFLRKIRAYTVRTGDWVFQLEKDDISYDIDV